VDFSAYAGDAIIDLRFSDSGAASIRGGAGDDQIWGNAGANVIVGGAGVDRIDISQGGNDTIVTSKGESGKAAGTLDVVTGFTAGDKLDFNLAAGAANNYVERDDDFTSFAQFLQNAAGALNSTVKYFVQDDGVDTYVAVNYGSGEADMVIVLAGVADATTLKFEDFVA
jgi:Ca2+-binding RTX toxin-like protein